MNNPRHAVKHYSKRLSDSIGVTTAFSLTALSLAFSSPFLAEKMGLTPQQGRVLQSICGGIGTMASATAIVTLCYVDSNRKFLKLADVADKEESMLALTLQHKRRKDALVNRYLGGDEDDETDSELESVVQTPVYAPKTVATPIPYTTPVSPPIEPHSHSTATVWQPDEIALELDDEDETSDWDESIDYSSSLMSSEEDDQPIQLSPIAEKIGIELERFALPANLTHWFLASPTGTGKTTLLKAIIWAWWTHFKGQCDIYIIDPKNEKTGWMGLEFIKRVVFCTDDDEASLNPVINLIEKSHKLMRDRNKNSRIEYPPFFLVIDEFTDLKRKIEAWDAKIAKEFMVKILSMATTGRGVNIHIFLVGHSLNLQHSFGKQGDSSLRNCFGMGALGRASVHFNAITSIFFNNNIIVDKKERQRLHREFETIKSTAMQTNIPLMVSTFGIGSVFALPHITFLNPDCDQNGNPILDSNERPQNFFVLQGLEQYETTEWKHGEPVFPIKKKPLPLPVQPIETTIEVQEPNDVTMAMSPPDHFLQFYEVVIARSLGQRLTQWEGDRVTVPYHDFKFPFHALPEERVMTYSLWFELINKIRDGKSSKDQIIYEVFNKRKGGSESYKRYALAYDIAKTYVPFVKSQRYGSEWTMISRNAKQATYQECVCCQNRATETHHALYSDNKGRLLKDDVIVGVHLFPLCDIHHRYYHEYKNPQRWLLDSIDSVRFNHQQIADYIELCERFDQKVEERRTEYVTMMV